MNLDRHKRNTGAGIYLAAGLLSALCAGPARADATAPIDDAFSRELVVYASAPEVGVNQAFSMEAVLYNSEPVASLVQSHSREAVLYNSEPTKTLTESYSREAALYNSEPVTTLEQAYSREAVLYLSESPIVDTFSREVVVFDGYYLPDATRALRIAAGTVAATATDKDRFTLAMTMAAQSRISLVTAAQVMRVAVSLQH